MTGSLYGTNGLVINNQDQKDADMLQFSVSGETTGASFNLWTNLSGDASTVHMRKAVLWWKPIAMLKLSIGNVGGYGYTEQLNWWKVPMGGSIAQAVSWEKRYSSASTGEAGGFQLDVDPMPGLTLTAGLYPGFGNATLIDGEMDANTAYGLQAKYNITGFGSVLAALRDDGLDESKLIRVGCDINAIPNLYAFITAIMLMDDHNDAYGAEDADGMMLRGVSIDNYVKYSMDKITIQARFPITLRLTDATGDDSYMLWRVKVSYAMDGGITPYLSAETVDYIPLNFAEVGDTFSVTIQPGVNVGIDKGSIDLSLKIDVYPDGIVEDNMIWSIPFEARISF
jgi:hypothetical protein